MNEDVIERYDTFNTKGCPEDLIFGDFNGQRSHPTTLIAQMIVTTMALKFTLP